MLKKPDTWTDTRDQNCEFDWSAVFDSFCYQKPAPIRAVFHLVPVSGKNFFSVCHRY